VELVEVGCKQKVLRRRWVRVEVKPAYVHGVQRTLVRVTPSTEGLYYAEGSEGFSLGWRMGTRNGEMIGRVRCSHQYRVLCNTRMGIAVWRCAWHSVVQRQGRAWPVCSILKSIVSGWATTFRLGN